MEGFSEKLKILSSRTCTMPLAACAVFNFKIGSYKKFLAMAKLL